MKEARCETSVFFQQRFQIIKASIRVFMDALSRHLTATWEAAKSIIDTGNTPNLSPPRVR
jgi:hypothetical protein